MATIPFFELNPSQVPSASGLPRASAQQFLEPALVQERIGAQVVQEGQRVSQEGQQFAQKYIEAKMVADISQQTSELSTQLSQVRFEAGKIPDREKATAAYDLGANKILAQYQQGGGDPIIRSQVEARFTRERDMHRVDVQAESFALESSTKKGDLDGRIQQYINTAANTNNPVLRAKAMVDMEADIKSMTEKGWLNPEQGAKAILQAKAELDEQRALNMVRTGQDFKAAVKRGEFPNLGVIQQERILSHADNLAIKNANIAYTQFMRQVVMNEKIETQTAEQVKKWVFDEVQKGTMTADKLKAVEPMMKKSSDWEAVNKLFYGAAPYDNRNTLTTLTGEIGKPGAQTQLNDAMIAGHLTENSFKELSRQQRELEKENTPQSPYRGGSEALAKAFDAQAVGVKNEFMAASMQQVGIHARQEFNARFEAMSAQDRQDRAKVNALVNDIIMRDGTEFVNNQRQAQQLPRFLDGTISRDKISPQNIMQALDKTEELFANGQISAEEHATEIMKLQSWKHLMAIEAAIPTPEPKPGEKKK